MLTAPGKHGEGARVSFQRWYGPREDEALSGFETTIGKRSGKDMPSCTGLILGVVQDQPPSLDECPFPH